MLTHLFLLLSPPDSGPFPAGYSTPGSVWKLLNAEAIDVVLVIILSSCRRVCVSVVKGGTKKMGLVASLSP